MTENKCWICLGDETEAPPLGSLADARDFVSPCHCSLTAHRRCMLDWLNSKGSLNSFGENARRDQNPWNFDIAIRIGDDAADGNGGERNRNRPQANGNGEMDAGFIGDVYNQLFGRRTLGLNVFNPYVIAGRCPQCKGPIMVTMKPSLLLSTLALARKSITRVAALGIITSSITAVLAGLASFVVITLNTVGHRVLTELFPPSVLSRLFGLTVFNSLDDAIMTRSLSVKELAKITLFPLFLWRFRSGSYSVQDEAFLLSYLSSFVNEVDIKKGFLKNLIYVFPSRYAYDLLFRLTFNRVYYNWAYAFTPSLFSDLVSEETIDVLEAQKDEQELKGVDEQSEFSKMERFNRALISIYRYFVPNLQDPSTLRSLNITKLEILNCIRRDFSKIFNEKSNIINAITTFVWPLLGSKLGHYIFSFQSFRSYTNSLSNTPDESLLLCNLIGCCGVVLAKDLVNIFFTWRKLQQIKELQILNSNSVEYNRASLLEMAREAQDQ